MDHQKDKIYLALKHIIVENLKNTLLENTLEDKQISPDTPLSELGVSSISFVRLVVSIETEFDFEFEDTDLDVGKFPTVQSMVTYIINNLS